MLTSDKDDADIKLIDFGFATIAEGNNLNQCLGTPAYVAPEIIEGHHYGNCDYCC
jgi:serine/threonine protein kinase